MRSKQEIIRPPRPPNSFFIYRVEKARQHRDGELPGYPMDLAGRSFSKYVGELWKKEPEEVQKWYKLLAEEAKKRHHIQYPHYQYRPNRRTKTADDLQVFMRRRAPTRRTLSHSTASSSSSSNTIDATITPDGDMELGLLHAAFQSDSSFCDAGPALLDSDQTMGDCNMVDNIVETLSHTAIASTSNAAPQMQWKGQISQWVESRSAAQQLYPAASFASYNFQPQVQPRNRVAPRGLISTHTQNAAFQPQLSTMGMQPSGEDRRLNHPQSAWDASCPPLDAGFFDFTTWTGNDARISASAELATTVDRSFHAQSLPVATGSGSGNPRQRVYHTHDITVEPLHWPGAQASQSGSLDPLSLPFDLSFLANPEADKLAPSVTSDFAAPHLAGSSTAHFPAPYPQPQPVNICLSEQQQLNEDWYALHFASDVAAFREAVMPRSSTPPLPGFDLAAYSFGEASGSGLGPLPDPLEMLPADAVWPKELDAFGINSSPNVEKSG